MRTLRVRNIAQKVLFDYELKGQISDGQWENSRPYDHYKPWCNAEVVVDPNNVGRNFFANRTSYNFSDKGLLEVVGDRMLTYVRLALTFGASGNDLETLEAVACNGGIPEYFTKYAGTKHDRNNYYGNKLEFAKTLDIDAVLAVASHPGIYSETELRRDLNDLRKIIKVQLI